MILRRSPLLLLAAALMALAVVFVHDPRPASADHGAEGTLWTATLTVQDIDGTFFGCGNTVTGKECSSTSALSDDDFTYAGTDYAITRIAQPSVIDNSLALSFSAALSDQFLSHARLVVGGTELRFSSATANSNRDAVEWASTGLSWSGGETVALELKKPAPPSGVELAGPDLDTSGGAGHFDLAVTEGASAAFTVALSADPGTEATVHVVRTQYFQDDVGADGHDWNMNAVSLSPQSLTFTAGNWATPQTVTVTGLEDDDDRPEQLVILILSPNRSEYDYVYVGPGNGSYNRTRNGSYTPATEGEYSYQLVDGYDPVGGSSNSVTGVHVMVADNDATRRTSSQQESGQGVSGSGGDCDTCGTAGEEGVLGQGQSPYAELISKMKEWRNDPKWVSFAAHTERWDRALKAFGESVADGSLTAMTAAEAQAFADRGEAWSRWVEVAAALQALEAAAQPPADQQADPAPQVVGAQQQQEPPNQAPVVSSALADATIVRESGTLDVSLAGVFRDADGDALTVRAASSNESVATVSVAARGARLNLSARSRGAAVITVTADDGRGGTVSDDFTVTVKSTPTVALAISDVSGLEVGTTQEISLAAVFRDPDADALRISAVSSNDAVATVASSGSDLMLTGVGAGEATVTVTARDADGNSVTAQFDATVVAAPEPEQTGVPDVVARYDANNNGAIDVSEYLQARRDHAYGKISDAEWQLVLDAWLASQYG